MKLSASQQAAVESLAERTLVVAGAGSGKTRTLVERAIHLLTERGASASDLLLATFTRKAAAEMEMRLLEALTGLYEEPRATSIMSGLTVGTFHSVALRVLRNDGDKLGYNSSALTVLDRVDAESLLKQICEELGYLRDGKWRAEWSWKKARASALTMGWPYGLCRHFCNCLKYCNCLTYELILTEAIRLLEERPDVAAKWRSKFKYVLVDELQDNDANQHTLCELIAGKAQWFGVGDHRQSIYAWRGARPDLMVSSPLDNLVPLDLPDCYRCGSDIITAANALMASSGERGAPLVAVHGKTGMVQTLVGRSSEIAGAVKCLHRPPRLPDATIPAYCWTDIAVLYRANRTGVRLECVFEEAGIPCHRVGSAFDVTETDDFRAVLAALRLIVNPRDDLAFARLVPVLGISAEEYAMVKARAADAGISHLAAHELVPSFTVFDGKSDILHAVSDLSAAVSDVFFFWDKHCQGMTVADALRWYALRDSQDDLTEDDKVTLSTVHSAKGLEWPCVIVAEMNERSFPSSAAISGDTIEEERRVAYVAFTRAQQRLVLHYRRPQDQAEGREPNAPSRFLKEAKAL